MKLPKLQDIIGFICKDTSDPNESPKLIIVIRILVLTMLLYIALNSIIYVRFLNLSGIVLLVISFAMYLYVFTMTYRQKTGIIRYTINFCMVVWVGVSVYYFGWDTGVQHFILVLLVLCYFSGYSNYGIKITYAFALCAFRIYLYFLCRSKPSAIALDSPTTNLLQIINTLTIFWCLSVIALLFSKDSQTLESKLVEYNSQLIDQANTDALTGLYNRRKAIEYLEDLLASSTQSFISLCICDIDFFKKVNDNYGHDIGDVVLQQISKTMKASAGDKCLTARWGGEEFLLVFPSSNGDEAYYFLENLRQRIKALRFEAGEKNFAVTMTFGLAEYDYKSDIDSFIKEADEKLYMGKENGRDQIVF